MNAGLHIPVPREFTGLARQFLQDVRVNSDICNEFWDDMDAAFARGDRTTGKVRPEYIVGKMRQWRQIDHWSTLALKYNDTKTKNGYPEFTLCSLAPAKWGGDWDGTEPSIAIWVRMLHMKKRSIIRVAKPLAIIGLHALARYFQRSINPDRGTLIKELIVVGKWVVETPLPVEDCAICIPTKTGKWVGEYTGCDQDTLNERIFAVRSYIG